MSRERTLYLVDGTYLLFRAFHSLPASMAVTGVPYQNARSALAGLLREGAGTACEPSFLGQAALAWLADPGHDRLPTNAVRGLTSVLLKLIREERPANMCVAFDLPGRVFRDDHYGSFVEKHPDYAPQLAGYKAYRPETPLEIHVQFPLARLVCARALGIPLLEAQGFEADDLIGTLARRACGEGFDVRIVTADKDLFQLVGEGISIFNPHKSDPSKASSYLLMDAQVVEQEFGVPPSQVVDVLALMGDSSDNIPGVPGIGEKGAKDLIRQFGSLEACILAAREEGKIARPAYRKGLLEHEALALFSKELATIRYDAPVSVDLADVWTHAADKKTLREIFGLLSFGALLKEAEALPPGSQEASPGPGETRAPLLPREHGDGEAGPSRSAAGTSSFAGPRDDSGTERPSGESEIPPPPSVMARPLPALEDRPGSSARGFPGPEPARARRPASARTGGEPPAQARLLFEPEEEAPAGDRSTAIRERAEPARGPAGHAAAGRAGESAGRAGESAGGMGKAAGGMGKAAGTGGVGGLRGVADPGALASTIDLGAADDAERYRVVLDAAELARLLPSILAAPRVAIDTETTSQDPMRALLVGISVAWEPHRAIYIPLAHRYLGAPAQPRREEVLGILAPVLESARAAKAGQNVKYDIEVLTRAGARPAGFTFDTMIAAFLLESDRTTYALGALAQEYLGDTKMAYADVAGKGAQQITFDEVEVGTAARYSGRDADVTLRLAEVLDRRLSAENLRGVFETIDMPLVEVLVAMETAGVRIDAALLARLSREMGEQIDALRAEIHHLSGHAFNLDSPRQLAAVLFDEIGLQPVSKTLKSRVSSTRDEDLEILATRHPLPARVRDYRALAKLRSTYVDALPALINLETGRVHTSFHPTGAATGRLSSSDPNLQNIPIRTAEGRKIRAAFVPEPGWTLISADYSQVELRVMAHLSGDAELAATFRRGEDIHRHTAAKIFGVAYEAVTAEQRRAAKTINFGILYGMGPQRLARELSLSLAAARELIESYFGRFPTIRAYIDRTIAGAEQTGFVSTLFGRIRRFPQLASTSRNQRQMAVRAAVNSTIQGTAADLMKIAMIRLHKALREAGLRARLLIQVHDELVLEAPPEELETVMAAIREAMETIPPFQVPLTVAIAAGNDWLAAKS